jgi:hypothetical protein
VCVCVGGGGWYKVVCCKKKRLNKSYLIRVHGCCPRCVQPYTSQCPACPLAKKAHPIIHFNVLKPSTKCFFGFRNCNLVPEHTEHSGTIGATLQLVDHFLSGLHGFETSQIQSPNPTDKLGAKYKMSCEWVYQQ